LAKPIINLKRLKLFTRRLGHKENTKKQKFLKMYNKDNFI